MTGVNWMWNHWSNNGRGTTLGCVSPWHRAHSQGCNARFREINEVFGFLNTFLLTATIYQKQSDNFHDILLAKGNSSYSDIFVNLFYSFFIVKFHYQSNWYMFQGHFEHALSQWGVGNQVAKYLHSCLCWVILWFQSYSGNWLELTSFFARREVEASFISQKWPALFSCREFRTTHYLPE